MSELFKRVKDIQHKAADSEVLVQEICRDIRKVLAVQNLLWLLSASAATDRASNHLSTCTEHHAPVARGSCWPAFFNFCQQPCGVPGMLDS